MLRAEGGYMNTIDWKRLGEARIRAERQLEELLEELLPKHRDRRLRHIMSQYESAVLEAVGVSQGKLQMTFVWEDRHDNRTAAATRV